MMSYKTNRSETTVIYLNYDKGEVVTFSSELKVLIAQFVQQLVCVYTNSFKVACEPISHHLLTTHIYHWIHHHEGVR